MSVRRAGVSAFGFGGTNFHMVMEEHIPGRLNGNGKKSVAVPAMPPASAAVPVQASVPNPVATATRLFRGDRTLLRLRSQTRRRCAERW